MHAALAAGGVDRHNVGVVQAGGRLSFVLEPLQLLAVECRSEGQYLQRHAPAQRDLLRLVYHAHAAAADFAEDAEVAEGAPGVECSPPSRRWPRRAGAARRAALGGAERRSGESA